MNIQAFEQFLSTISVADLHIQSYNHFVVHELPNLIQNLSVPIQDGTFEFFGVHVPPACALKNGMYCPIYPFHCRRENLSYLSPVMASIQHQRRNERGETETQIFDNLVLAHIPVMLGSCICHTQLSLEGKQFESETDDGGYFIINGVERVLVTQRRKCYNFPQVLKTNETYSVNMRSISKETQHSVLIEFMSAANSDAIFCQLPYVSAKIPLGILISAFGALGASFYEEMGLDKMAGSEMSEDEALEYIGAFASKKSQTAPIAEEEVAVIEEEEEEEAEEVAELEGSETETVLEEERLRIHHANNVRFTRQLIDIELFPHIGLGAPLEVKYRTVCAMVRKLLLAKQGKMEADNRDNLLFHRFETSGILLSELFNMFLRNFLNTYKEGSKNSTPTDFANKLEMFMTKNIKSCMATGKWGVHKGSYVRQGVSQVLARLSVLGTRSHLQRLMLPVGKEGKNVKVRLVHPSHYGYVCLFETPEGQGCGIVLNFTPAVRVSNEIVAPFVRDLVRPWVVEEAGRGIDVWIDNTFVFSTAEPEGLLARLRDLRARSVLPAQVSIYAPRCKQGNIYEIRLFAEKGRILRPFLNPQREIVYLDPAEIQGHFVAMFPEERRWDYCELHPSLLLSGCSGSIPFSDHIQSPRIVYESSMLKQAIGFFATNYPIRYDTTCEVLDYSQKCLVSTAVGRAYGMHEAPAGINCVVAIMTMGSWNAEDCVLINKAAIERGLFASTTYKTISVEEYKLKNNEVRRFCIPDPALQKPTFNYDLLDERGIVRKGSVVTRKDVLVGCVKEVMKKGKGKDILLLDCSELAEEEGTVERTELIETFTGNRIVNIILKIRKIPERGDKFANLNAQKGTCGLIVPPEDMPFCAEDGIIPDILVNPNALPSRMTISMFFEMVLGQEACLDGNFRDATPFDPHNALHSEPAMGAVLKAHGYDSLGWKMLMDGTTGRPLRARVYMGVNYYQKLKHMVSNKINARNFGNVTISTRQPVSGRSKRGGIRAGEMEVQGWLSHGVSSFLREKLFTCSDTFSVFVCNQCQQISNHKDQCHQCQGEVIETHIPYASKIVFQLLNMCLIKTALEVKVV